jgi:hypothetical protein
MAVLPSPHQRAQSSARGALLLSLYCLAGSMTALADESVPIGRIAADPEPYHLRFVTLQGTVQHVHVLEPYRQPSGNICYGTYLFTLQDDTGSLDVAVLGMCGVAIIRPPEVSDGDKVIVKAQVQAPGHLGDFYGLDRRPHPGANPQGLHAIAKEIQQASQ